MITAFVMMNAERDRIAAIPDELLKMTGVTEVYSIAGDFDLVVIVRVKEAEDLAGVVTERFAKVKGITRTMTLIAFKSYSNYDLENMFSLGFSSSNSKP
ncbi:MAG: Lrp/AsnC ligand binding domain-containing protein [Candidatus Bathyarchaeia archaeon]|jgi:DNA-binding Lrp family transcriptional regulator